MPFAPPVLLALVKNVNRGVVLNAQNHGFEDVNVPALVDPKPDRILGFGHQPTSQRHSNTSRQNPQNHRLPDPDRVTTVHPVHPKGGPALFGQPLYCALLVDRNSVLLKHLAAAWSRVVPQSTSWDASMFVQTGVLANSTGDYRC